MKVLNEWKSILLENVGSFQKVRFDIPKGITTIYGSNGKSANSNASGKSMLFTTIFDTAYEAPIGAERSDRIKTGTRGLHLNLGGKSVKLLRNGSRSSLKVDGVVTHGAVNVRKKLDSILPWSIEDVVTYIHLDSQVPHPLVKGTNAHRKQFLTKFFPLDKIDSEKKILKQELDRLSKAAGTYELLNEELAKLKKSFPSKELVQKLRSRQSKLSKELEELQSSSAESEINRRAALFKDQAEVELKHYESSCDESGYDDLDKIIKFYTEQYDKYIDTLEDARKYSEFLAQQNKYDEWVQSLSPTTIKFLESGRVDIDYRKKAALVRSSEMRAQVIRDRMNELKDSCADLENVPEQPDIPYNRALAALENFKHQLEHAKKFGEGKCPTCGGTVKIADVNQLKTKIRSAERMVRANEEYQLYEEALERQQKARAEFRKLKTEYSAIVSARMQNKKWLLLDEELAHRVTPPKPYTGKKLILEVHEKVIAELADRLKALKFLAKNRELFDAIQEGEALEDESQSDLERVASVSREITQIQAKLERLHSMIERKKELEEKLLLLKPKLSKARALEELLSGYDDKAMKKLVIQAISTRLNDQLNKYTRMVFKDDFRFELVWDAHQVQFLVHRHFRNRTDTTDVRRLSGAETKLFTIALVLALLTFVPDSKRSSLLVLDEPTANFGEANTEAFKEILPVLNRVIPSVIIITPRTEERFGGHEFTISKVNGVTKILKGHPSVVSRTTNEATHRLSA